jgi:glycosyltransferase involved in cell wall biosynthesis
VTWHEVWGNKYWDEYLGRFGFLAAAIERLTMKLPDKIIAVSQMTSNRLVTAGVDPKKITLINNFVNAEDIIGSTTNLPNTDLLFVGRLISHKRVDLILEALSLLVLEGIYPTISIVGTGPELENLRTQAREKSIGQQINFYSENLDSNDVWGLMASCKIFVSASEREGYGIAVLEAITAGAKVLVSNHEDNAARFLVSQDLGGIVEEQSPGAWADSIKNGLSEWTKNTEFVFRPDLNLKNFGIEYMDSWKKVLAIK